MSATKLFGDRTLSGPRKALAAVVVVIGALLLLPAVAGLFLSLFLYDAPGAADSPLTNALATTLWLAPVLLIGAIVLGARAFFGPAERALWPAAALLVAAPGLVALAFAAIEARCGGSFVCP